MRVRALTLWCALAAIGVAAAYTVDCNPEYTDCDTELSKIVEDDDEPTTKRSTTTAQSEQTTQTPNSITTPVIATTNKPTDETTTETTEEEIVDSDVNKPSPRLLNLNVEELQNFANALHNQTREDKKKGLDLSDVTLDDDDEDAPHTLATFQPMERTSEEEMTCKENNVAYKIGETLERGCDESCVCAAGGILDCSPRCKHPYIRRGRRLNDPLCFESPVDACCSIVACTTGQGDAKPKQMCKYGNESYPVGHKWYIGCEQECSCAPNSVVTCQPRCKPLLTSDKCINVQDPNDACCEIQVCDVSQDVHEIIENVTTTTPASAAKNMVTQLEDLNDGRSKSRPLVLAEPIGSVKVLQNNTVQVNLIHLNDSEDPIHLLLSSNGGKSFKDVELKYSNLILNLEGGKDYILKTKETGTRFNFTMTTANEVAAETESVSPNQNGCWEDGKFYEIGEEFHIGCSELCECTGPDTKECAALACPNHVGLELMSKGCVRWAPSPPATPPNCCPRSARCLSDGTCYYNSVPVPNWTEVPLSLTGCERRCFCENGDLDCQEVCSPLPPVPPQSMRCPPMHRPAPVNISDEDCCKQWGCVPTGDHGSSYKFSMPDLGDTINYDNPTPPSSAESTNIHSTFVPPFLNTLDFYRHLNPVKPHQKIKGLKPKPDITPVPDKHSKPDPNYHPRQNITVFTSDEIDLPFKVIKAEPPLLNPLNPWPRQNPAPKATNIENQNTNLNNLANAPKPHHIISHISHLHPETHIKLPFADFDKHNIFYQPKIHLISNPQSQSQASIDQHFQYTPLYEPNNTIMSSADDVANQASTLDPRYQSFQKSKISSTNFKMFQPGTVEKIQAQGSQGRGKPISEAYTTPSPVKVSFFRPEILNRSEYLLHSTQNPLQGLNLSPRKHITILNSKDLRVATPTSFHDDDWSQSSSHVLSKQPNPYETVLLRAIHNPTHSKASLFPKPDSLSQKPSTLSLEHLLSQMELESEVNRNLGRSADTNQAIALGHAQPEFPHKPQVPFLPTIPPETRYPEEDIPGYDQNNIHRPIGPDDIPGAPAPTGFGDLNKKLSVISVESDSPNSVTMLLGLPSVLVGLRGSVDLRYTDTADEDVSHWYSQVFAPADEILTTPRLEFRLTGLKPSTTYKIRGKLFLHNLPVAPASDVYSVRTQDLPVVVPLEEKQREIDSRLTVVDVNDTTAHVSWRHFSEDELQFIDGIQVRFRPVGTPIYSMTELLHHSRLAAELHDLRPGSRYEASLVLVPPPRATTELNDPARVEFNTKPYIDPYNWTVSIDVRTVGSEAASLSWTGVPSPAERWVRVYRAAHACGDQPGTEQDEFKLAARDQPMSVTLVGLRPDSRCRVWLELFLTNGKVKTSNVLEINTKAHDTDNDIDNEISASSISSGSHRSSGDYYSALVGVGVVAALGALTSLLLLLVVVRRHRPRSANITPVPTAPRESSLPPYDNPAYKLELQQETMDL